jgi:hypothetical protein
MIMRDKFGLEKLALVGTRYGTAGRRRANPEGAPTISELKREVTISM